MHFIRDPDPKTLILYLIHCRVGEGGFFCLFVLARFWPNVSQISQQNGCPHCLCIKLSRKLSTVEMQHCVQTDGPTASGLPAQGAKRVRQGSQEERASDSPSAGRLVMAASCP